MYILNEMHLKRVYIWNIYFLGGPRRAESADNSWVQNQKSGKWVGEQTDAVRAPLRPVSEG